METRARIRADVEQTQGTGKQRQDELGRQQAADVATLADDPRGRATGRGVVRIPRASDVARGRGSRSGFAGSGARLIGPATVSSRPRCRFVTVCRRSRLGRVKTDQARSGSEMLSAAMATRTSGGTVSVLSA